ncbi:putative toxin-antitoxin system toxin component, PIN family [Arcticibacter tournemirensis]|uniref:Putative toxin-antitoxin system toxin component, PIN family n=1 Tax=Arcticibacter tournemirensis TaxID=699437 RepID=A0A5M9HF91_9SPHI|nr:putative toxin-antitoxin system toxin component, PIN family [Arcticibacter tournemirensis]
MISKKYHLLDRLLYTNKVRILFCLELIEELASTITKPKLRKYFTGNALDDMIEAFDAFIDFVAVKSNVEICRDPKDNFLLALAKDGKADYLLTGDKDLLDIEKFGRTKILTLTNFLNEITIR